jgi:hypothetical protein
MVGIKVRWRYFWSVMDEPDARHRRCLSVYASCARKKAKVYLTRLSSVMLRIAGLSGCSCTMYASCCRMMPYE